MSTKNKNIIFVAITMLVVAIAITIFIVTAPKYPADSNITATNESDQNVVEEKKEWKCLEDGFAAEYRFEDKGLLSGKLYVDIKERVDNIYKKASDLFIDTDVRTSAYPVETRKCGIYYNKLLNHNSDELKQPAGFKSELFVSDYNGRKKKILVFSEYINNEYCSYYSPSFRVSDNEEYVALVTGWYGEPDDHAVVIKSLETGEDKYVITLRELMDDYGVSPGSIELVSSGDNIAIFELLGPGNPFIKLHINTGEIEIFN